MPSTAQRQSRGPVAMAMTETTIKEQKRRRHGRMPVPPPAHGEAGSQPLPVLGDRKPAGETSGLVALVRL